MEENFLNTPKPPDVADLPPEQAGALSAAARAGGFAVFYLEGALMRTKPELMTHLAQALGFPGDFGRNWDAVIDYLGDMATFHGNNKILILVRNPAAILEADPELCSDLRKSCALACENSREWGRGAVTLKFVFIA